MSEGKSGIEGTLDAVSGLVEKVPIYQDAIQPLAKEAGKALGTVGRSVNAALMPIRGLIWGVEQIEAFLQHTIAQKLENVAPEDIQTPDPCVAGPAIESLRFTGHKADLSELYANLLATSMDKNTASTAHPGFVEIIRSLSGDEARIMSFLSNVQVAPIIDIRKEIEGGGGGVTVMPYVTTVGFDAGCDHRELTVSYIKNLERLGLIEISKDKYLVGEGAYDRILNDAPVKEIEEQLNAQEGYIAKFEKYYLELSAFGSLFIAACVNSRDKV